MTFRNRIRQLSTRFLLALTISAGTASPTMAAPSVEVVPSPTTMARLKAEEPQLFALFTSYRAYYAAFSTYATQQGFRAEIENLVTAIHEMVHLASAAHSGYYVDGVYYEPHVRRAAWPFLVNRDIAGAFEPWEKGPIFASYLPNTPNNHLGNIVDEINAYAHVLPFVCRNEPGSADKQVQNLVGHLNVQEVYLRSLRLQHVDQYKRLAGDRESRGAINLITNKAWSALQQCGFSKQAMPGREADFFLKYQIPDGADISQIRRP